MRLRFILKVGWKLQTSCFKQNMNNIAAVCWELPDRAFGFWSQMVTGPSFLKNLNVLHRQVQNMVAHVQLSQQNQKPHSKNKMPHGKTKNLTAKRQKKVLVLPWVFAFAVRYLVLPLMHDDDEEVMNIWKSYMKTAGWRTVWKKIIAVIDATFAVYNFHLFITNQFNDLLPVGWWAQLVESSPGIAEVKGSNPRTSATAKVASITTMIFFHVSFFIVMPANRELV